MNSDVYKEISSLDKADMETAKERNEHIENTTLVMGKDMDALMNTQAWKLLDRDLEQIQTGLMNKLRYGTGQTKSQMDRYIDQVNMIDYFRKTPLKYVIRMKQLVKRKIKGI